MLLALAFAYVVAAAVLVFLVESESSETVGSTGGTSVTTTTSQTLFEVDGWVVATIVGVLAALWAVAAASLAWRVRHRSARVGVCAMAAVGVLGVFAALSLLTVGVALVPLAAALALVARPLTVFSVPASVQ